MLLVTLMLLALPQERGLVEHWRLRSGDYEHGAIQPFRGERAIAVEGAPTWIGEGDVQALVRPKGAPLLVIDPAATRESLPVEEISAAAWVAIDTTEDWGGILCALEDNGNHERGWLLGTRGRNFLCAVASEGTGRLSYLRGRRTIRPGIWYHVVFSYDGEEMRLYVNGELEASTPEPEGPILYDTRHQLVAAAYKDADEDHRLHGAVNELRLYDEALNESEIATLYRRGLRLVPALEQGSATGLPAQPDAGELAAEINRAIDRGAEALLRRQNRDGSWSAHTGGYRNGMTALAVYALLKSGLPEEHASIRNALRYLRQRLPEKTYSAGVQLLAYSALEEPAPEAEIRAIVDRLLDWEHGSTRGTWSYPQGAPDLSNTQYAALGLWAAHGMGVDVSKGVWQRLVEATVVRYQHEIERRDFQVSGASGATGVSRRPVGGYRYRPDNPGQRETGSMTTAGLCVLGTAEQVVGRRLGGRYLRMATASRDAALNWLELHYSVRTNPGNPGRLHYYLYGLERVAAFYELEHLGPFDWYRDGAAFLVEKQEASGTWAGNEAKTAFSLLFLVKATSPVSGDHRFTRSGNAWNSADDGLVQLRVTGENLLTLWVNEISENAVPLGERIHVHAVEYLLDDQVIGQQEADGTRPWDGSRFPMRHRIEEPGRRRLVVRVQLAEEDWIESEPLEIEVRRDPERFQEEAEEMQIDNLLLRVHPKVSASSQQGNGEPPGRAVDGREATRWICAEGDTAPWIQIDLQRPVRARSLLLSPVDSSIAREGEHAQVLRVSVSVNDLEAFEHALDEDPLMPTRLPLDPEVPVRRLRIEILERAPARGGHLRCGFSEIGLEGRARRGRR